MSNIQQIERSLKRDFDLKHWPRYFPDQRCICINLYLLKYKHGLARVVWRNRSIMYYPYIYKGIKVMLIEKP